MFNCRKSYSLLILAVVAFSSFAFAEGPFNTEDKNALTNGNMVIAVLKVQTVSPEELEKTAQSIPVSDLTKKIYTTIGKPVKIRGKVYKVEELPPNDAIPGVWTDILLLVNNKNAPLGATTVEFMYKGDSSNIDSNDVVTCTGYLVGTYENHNAFGGKIEAVMLVGNHFKKEGKSR